MGNPTEATLSARVTKKFYLVKLQEKKIIVICDMKNSVWKVFVK